MSKARAPSRAAPARRPARKPATARATRADAGQGSAGAAPAARDTVATFAKPRTLTDEALLPQRETRLLAALVLEPGIGLAWLDLAGGRMGLMELPDLAALAAELERLSPAEWLYPEGAALPEWLGRLPGAREYPP